MGLFKKASIAAAVMVPVLGLAGMYVANADTGPSDIVSVTGSGTISPGVWPTSCPSSAPHVTFSGTMIFTPNSDDAAQYNGRSFGFDGDSTSACATLISDSGSLFLTGAISGNVRYSRTGTEETISGTVVLNGETHALTAVCQFVPTNFNPTTTYQMACQAVLNS